MAGQKRSPHVLLKAGIAGKSARAELGLRFG